MILGLQRDDSKHNGYDRLGVGSRPLVEDRLVEQVLFLPPTRRCISAGPVRLCTKESFM